MSEKIRHSRCHSNCRSKSASSMSTLCGQPSKTGGTSRTAHDVEFNETEILLASLEQTRLQNSRWLEIVRRESNRHERSTQLSYLCSNRPTKIYCCWQFWFSSLNKVLKQICCQFLWSLFKVNTGKYYLKRRQHHMLRQSSLIML